jgi:hypothetical protein
MKILERKEISNKHRVRYKEDGTLIPGCSQIREESVAIINRKPDRTRNL